MVRGIPGPLFSHVQQDCNPYSQIGQAEVQPERISARFIPGFNPGGNPQFSRIFHAEPPPQSIPVTWANLPQSAGLTICLAEDCLVSIELIYHPPSPCTKVIVTVLRGIVPRAETHTGLPMITAVCSSILDCCR